MDCGLEWWYSATQLVMWSWENCLPKMVWCILRHPGVVQTYIMHDNTLNLTPQQIGVCVIRKSGQVGIPGLMGHLPCTT